MRRLTRKKGARLLQVRSRRDLRELPDSLLCARISPESVQERPALCFTGHRHLSLHETALINARLEQLLEVCYQSGYRDFLCGGALGFDALAAESVLRLQSAHEDVRLRLVLPCGDQARFWTERDTVRYERILYAADDIRVLAPTYYNGCMHARNRYMVDHSSLCVCYLRHQKGGTASTVAYAVREGIPVINVAMENACAAFRSE